MKKSGSNQKEDPKATFLLLTHFTNAFALYRWFSAYVTAAMLVHRTIEKEVFWEFDSILMQNMSHNLLLFCAPTWPSYHVIHNHLYNLMIHSMLTT